MTEVADQYDAIVVGGGPAGSCTAGLLRRRGYSVMLLEREKFPRYHIGETLLTGINNVIEDLGITERLDGMGFPRKYGLSLVWGKDRFLWDVKFREGGYSEYSYHVERAKFDQLLLDRVVELGATVLQQATVRKTLMEGERVTGVQYTTEDGQRHEARARIVIDASGQARVIGRRFTRINWYEDLQNIATWTYFKNAAPLPPAQRGNALIEKVRDRNGWFWAIPIEQDLLSVGYVRPTSDPQNASQSSPEIFWDNVAHTRELSKLLVNAWATEEKFRSARDWSYLADRFAGEGWVAVGDAAGFIDPLLSTGCCLGMLCADKLAEAVDLVLRAPEREGDILSRYEEGCKIFLREMAEYVRFFYDADRELEDYFTVAQSMAENFREKTPRSSFVAAISGLAPLAGLFDFSEFEEPVAAVS